MNWKSPRKSNDNLRWDSERVNPQPKRPLFTKLVDQHKIYFDVPEFLVWLSEQEENMELKVNHKTMNAIELANQNPGYEKIIEEIVPRFIKEIMTKKEEPEEQKEE